MNRKRRTSAIAVVSRRTVDIEKTCQQTKHAAVSLRDASAATGVNQTLHYVGPRCRRRLTQGPREHVEEVLGNRLLLRSRMFDYGADYA